MTTHIDQSNSVDDVAIFGLPDELLMKVFTYITRISRKMELEQVSRRFRFVSSQSPCWRGIHKLEIMMKCWYYDCRKMEMKGICNEEFSHLNNHSINVKKWPAAVQLLIDRTQIQQLIVHGGCYNHILNDNPTLLTDLMEIFKKNGDKMKIEFLEFHYEDDALNTKGSSQFDRVKSFLCHSIQMSIPYLKELVSINIKEILMCEMWPIVKECQNLRSIAFEGYMVNVDALVGKPLTKMTVGGRRRVMVFYMDGVARAINGASGQGVSNLTLLDNINLRRLYDGLTEKSREKLKIITIILHSGGIEYKSRLFPFIPSMFPNLQKLNLIDSYIFQSDTNELLTNFVSFLTLCHGESFPREIVLQKIEIRTELDEFKLRLTNKCEAAEINVQFDKMEDLSRNTSESVLLSKGKASIRMYFCDEKKDDSRLFYYWFRS